MSSPTIDSTAEIAVSAKIWGGAVVREGARIGNSTIIGSGVYIDSHVLIGANCKIQNAAQIYSPACLSDGVFIGPSVVFTNDKHPRAVTPDGALKSTADWDAVGVEVAEGAAIGAGSVCVAPLRIGKWALIAAGSVVIKDVGDFELVAGNPARQIGWVGRAGFKLVPESQNYYKCPQSGERYIWSLETGMILAGEQHD